MGYYEKKIIKCNNVFIDKCKIFNNNENINDKDGQQIDDFTKGKKGEWAVVKEWAL
ncbi:MAG: hypothetical protein Q4C58_08515 [Eubacteriales bacterium]|nr:hypothetical protein [Eubacteriales bacterium]